MSDPVAIWHAEHVRFARLLDFLEQQMVAFHEGQDPDYELMRDIVYYLHHYADRFHHPREDVAFTRLVERDSDLKIPVNRLLQEHRVLAAIGETLLQHLEDILEDVVIRREIVESAASTYLVYFRHHLRMEETEILPHASRLLQPADWAAVAAAPSDVDPLFGSETSGLYRALRKQLAGAG